MTKLFTRRKSFLWKKCLLILILIFYFIKFLSINIENEQETIFGPVKCIISVTHKWGRLGNRMFLLATGYALARIHSCHLYISPEISSEIRLIFNVNFSVNLLSYSRYIFMQPPLKFINQTVGCEYFPNLMQPNAIEIGTQLEIDGFWQSYLHFHQYRNDFQEQIFTGVKFRLHKISRFFEYIYQEKFNRKLNLSIDNHQLLKQQLTSIQLIGVHIRLGDFVPLNFSSNTRYLFDSMNYFQKQFSNVSFIITSDNKTYCKNLFHNQSNVFLTPSTFSPGDDMITLSLCQHSIITGGTFSWWSGYLAGGQVLHDKVYPSPCKNITEYFPSWFKIH